MQTIFEIEGRFRSTLRQLAIVHVCLRLRNVRHATSQRAKWPLRPARSLGKSVRVAREVPERRDAITAETVRLVGTG